MNKRNIKHLVLLFIFVFVVGIKFNTKTISTEFKKVNANNKSDETDLLNVTDRELALLASLVYEPVPNEKLYTKSLNQILNNLGVQSLAIKSISVVFLIIILIMKQ